MTGQSAGAAVRLRPGAARRKLPLSSTAALRKRPAPVVRKATLGDLDTLVLLEERCFSSDRLSRRSFRHLLTKGHAATLIAEEEGRPAGYALVLLNRGTALARLYSLAVDPDFRRRGIGTRLLTATEQEALAAGAVELRLEVRTDNHGAIASYERQGFRPFGTYVDFYEDHADAIRMAKRLAGGKRADLARVPYYAQTLPFTCGPSSLMMALRSLDPSQPLDRKSELRLWREATLIYMTSGHGGCDPFGLAVAAERRGFKVRVYVTDEREIFVDSVRDPAKKEVIRLVLQDFRAELKRTGTKVLNRGLSLAEAIEAMKAGAIPVVLISSYALTGDKAPHWVVLTGFDDRFVYLHDPDADQARERPAIDCVNIPIPHADFTRMARYGATRLRAAIVILPKG